MAGYRGKQPRRWLKILLALVLAGILCFAGLFGAVMYGAYDHVSGDPQVMIVLGCRVMPGGQTLYFAARPAGHCPRLSGRSSRDDGGSVRRPGEQRAHL